MQNEYSNVRWVGLTHPTPIRFKSFDYSLNENFCCVAISKRRILGKCFHSFDFSSMNGHAIWECWFSFLIDSGTVYFLVQLVKVILLFWIYSYNFIIHTLYINPWACTIDLWFKPTNNTFCVRQWGDILNNYIAYYFELSFIMRKSIKLIK